MTSSNGNISALLALCAGNSPVPGEFTAQRPVTRSFDVSFDLRLNKRLNKQSWGWWFETLPSPLWRHCNGRRHVRRGLLLIVMLLNGNFLLALYMCTLFELWLFGRSVRWGNMAGWRHQLRMKSSTTIIPGTSVVNESPPMPLRASSHPGIPNCPSCPAFAWPGLSPSGGSGKRIPVARTAAQCRYANQPQVLKYSETCL